MTKYESWDQSIRSCQGLGKEHEVHSSSSFSLVVLVSDTGKEAVLYHHSRNMETGIIAFFPSKFNSE